MVIVKEMEMEHARRFVDVNVSTLVWTEFYEIKADACDFKAFNDRVTL